MKTPSLKLDFVGNKKDSLLTKEASLEAADLDLTIDTQKAIPKNELKIYWDRFAANLRQKGKMSEFTILKKEISLEENNIIKLTLDNVVQLDQLNSFKTELLDYLRKQLKNSSILIEATIVEQPTEKKLYTDTEKLEYLTLKNPLILELKNRLGLDI